MNIGIIGAGYVGLVTGACFAEIGHRVICQDSDKTKIDTLKKGEIPIYEPFLDKIIAKNCNAGRLFFTENFSEAVKPSEVIFICVGTPPLENGEADLSSVEWVAREIAQISEEYKLVVEKSTVPVQTGSWIEKTLRVNSKKNQEFGVASNPEFLREGSAVGDFLHPDRIVIGVQNKKAENILRNLYAPIIDQKFKCPVHSNCAGNVEIPFIVLLGKDFDGIISTYLIALKGGIWKPRSDE